MIIRLLIQISLILLVAACAMPPARTSDVPSYDSIELSQGVVKLINNAGDKPIALEDDERIRCVDMNPSGHDAPSRFCQTFEEFNSNLERGRDLIRSINSNTQP